MASTGVPSPNVYLAPNFEPSALKVAQLRGILFAHQITVPSTAKKADLVQLFEDNVRPRAQKLLSDASSVKPSNKGITEIGHDGEPIAALKTAKRPRQSRVKKSAVPEVEPVVDDADPGADGETEDNDAELVEIRQMPRRTTRRSVAASSSPPLGDLPISLPSTTRKSRKSTMNLAPPLNDDSPVQDSVHVLVPSTIPRTVKKKPSVAVLREESEPEDEKARGNSKAGKIDVETAAPEVTRHTKSRKSVVVREDHDAEGGNGNFSDFNPFQSGGENSPQMGVAEQVRLRKKRQTLGGATTSATPSRANRRRSEPGQGHNPLTDGSPDKISTRALPAAGSGVTPPSLKKFQPELGQMRSPPDEWKKSRLSNVAAQSGDEIKDEEDQQDHADDFGDNIDLAKYEQHNKLVSERISGRTRSSLVKAGDGGDSQTLAVQRATEDTAEANDSVSVIHRTEEVTTSQALIKPTADTSATKHLSQILIILLVSILTPVLRSWQAQSNQIGYCDTGSNVNNRLIQDRRAKMKTIDCKSHKIEDPEYACQLEQESFFDILGIAPDSCTPCPEHAVCQNGELLRCQQGYQLVPDWRQTEMTKYLLDGLPATGPVAFPPSCQIDFKRKALSARIAKEIESDLAKRHGDVVCSQSVWNSDLANESLDIVRDGMSEEELKESLFGKMKLSKEDFEEQFGIAVKDLLAYDNIGIARLDNGTTYYAATRSVIPTSCALKIKTAKEAKQHKKEIGLLSFISALTLLLQNRYKQKKAEDAQVKELVAISLAKLQDRKHLHFTEPETASEPYLRPDQMRDDVLILVPQAQRKHLWARVQGVVESNANVQVDEQEVFGDVWKTWEWVGSTRKDLQERSMFPVA
ncbi:hypothetical protein QFC22_000407 [Naganishia vaughanmartiniae]|uniref:Uncharacterized protein n=1 Tax=Naganishia vaughanmartiniae TaxID=1424756 RepID=A0ACC2XQ10_9TREE|nr:hypothetical protein QFC22_000407 [Naganishia vaughanmartiniae]